MRRTVQLTLGIFAVVIGAVWILQGLGYFSGSAMTGEPIWAVIGTAVGLAGLLAILFALRIPRQ